MLRHEPYSERRWEEAQSAYRKGMQLVEDEKFAEAAPWFEFAVRCNREHVRAWHELGVARQQLGDVEGAKQAFEVATAINPHFIDSWDCLDEMSSCHEGSRATKALNRSQTSQTLNHSQQTTIRQKLQSGAACLTLVMVSVACLIIGHGH